MFAELCKVALEVCEGQQLDLNFETRDDVTLDEYLGNDAVKVLHSICQQIWNTQQWPQDWKRSVFIPIPKKGNFK